MSGASSFRGYWSIGELVERMVALAQHNERFRPDIKHLTLDRRDIDLIRRWPKAATAHQITVSKAGCFWRGFELREKAGLGRYEKPAAEQAVIE